MPAAEGAAAWAGSGLACWPGGFYSLPPAVARAKSHPRENLTAGLFIHSLLAEWRKLDAPPVKDSHGTYLDLAPPRT